MVFLPTSRQWKILERRPEFWPCLIKGYEYPSKRHTKSNQHMGILHTFSKSNQHLGILHAFSKCVREIFNHEFSPSEVDWGDPKGEHKNAQAYIKWKHAHGS